MKCIVALVICTANILACHGFPREVITNGNNKYPTYVQHQQWNNRPRPCATPALNYNTQYLDELLAANLEAILNPKPWPVIRQLRDESSVRSSKKSHRQKAKSSSSGHKVKSHRPSKDSDDAFHEDISYKGGMKSGIDSVTSEHDRGSYQKKVTRATVETPASKTESKDTESVDPKTVKQMQEEELLQTYRLLYKLLAADPLFGFGYDPLLRMTPASFGPISSLGKDVGGVENARENNQGESSKTKKSQNSDKDAYEYEHNIKSPNIESRSVSDGTEQSDADSSYESNNSNEEHAYKVTKESNA